MGDCAEVGTAEDVVPTGVDVADGVCPGVDVEEPQPASNISTHGKYIVMFRINIGPITGRMLPRKGPGALPGKDPCPKPIHQGSLSRPHIPVRYRAGLLREPL